MASIDSSHDETPTFFTDSGSGSPEIVLVPGLTGDRSDFAVQVAQFQQSNRVVALDPPGSGASGNTRVDWSMAAFGADVATVVDHLGLVDVILVGHSFGGDAVVEAALLLERRVKALVLVSSYRTLGSQGDDQEIAEWLAPFKSDFRSAMKFDHEPALIEALSRIDMPVFAINPDFKPNDAEALERHGIQLRVIPGVGHYTMTEAPAAFNDELADILAGLQADD